MHTYMVEVGRRFCITLQHSTGCDEDIKNHSPEHTFLFHGLFRYSHFHVNIYTFEFKLHSLGAIPPLPCITLTQTHSMETKSKLLQLNFTRVIHVLSATQIHPVHSISLTILAQYTL
jgi:hypothetical protein